MTTIYKRLLWINILYSNAIIILLTVLAIKERNINMLSVILPWIMLVIHDYIILQIIRMREREKGQPSEPQPKEPYAIGDTVLCNKENITGELDSISFFSGETIYGIKIANGQYIYRYAEDIEKYEKN